MHANQRAIVTFAVQQAQQEIFVEADGIWSAVFSMHTVQLEFILIMCIDPAVQDGLSGHSHAGV